MSELTDWRKAEKHLPRSMRDFHDQKDLFKTIHDFYLANPKSSAALIDWTQAHCYVMDCFLPFMAYHGYTIQKCRADLEFCSLDQSIQAYKDKVTKAFQACLEEHRNEIANASAGDGI